MHKTNKKVVIFDLDGTILDTMGDIAAAVNYALAFYGYPERSVKEVQSFIGNGSLMLIRRALSKGSNDEFSDEFLREVRSRFRDEYATHMYDTTYPYEGITELIDELNGKGICCAVITNKDDRSAVPMIKRYFGNRFRLVRGVRADSERKPSPDLTLSVLKELGFTPDEAVFVGDGMADLNVSKNCNIDFIPVGYGYTDPERLYAESKKQPVSDVASLRSELLAYL